MGKTFLQLENSHIDFIKNQKIFFVTTAPESGHINLSPKGMDSFRVVDNRKVVWLNYTGSGNETAAHIMEDPRMTIMFCAFHGDPLILRIYGSASILHPRDDRWSNMLSIFPDPVAARQIFEIDIDMVKASCGEGIPFYDYVGERDSIQKWYLNKGPEGIQKYWRENNTRSLDGKLTGIE